MAFLLDTNIISELRKGRSDCNARVWSWYEATPLEEIYLSVLVLGEMRKGVEMKRKADPASAAALERWLREVVAPDVALRDLRRSPSFTKAIEAPPSPSR